MTTKVLVCCGVGGTGKTTTAAALAVAHACAGRRTVVLTIDPARRLADALGVTLSNEPQIVLGLDAIQPGAAPLAAMMLDRQGTWDGLVRRYARDEAHAQRLFANRYYQAVVTRLTGSHEYMAIEKLYTLVAADDWDVIVLDTPPTQHVLEFFEAPERVHRLLDRGAVATLLKPGAGLLGLATRHTSGIIERLAGASVMKGLSEFFELFGAVAKGLEERSAAVAAVLASEDTQYLLVTDAGAPERSDVLGFLEELRKRGMNFAGFLLNRTAPDATFAEPLLADRLVRPDAISPEEWDRWTGRLLAIPALAAARAARHRINAVALAQHGGTHAIWRVPEVPGGVSSLAGLAALAPYLPPRPPPPL